MTTFTDITKYKGPTIYYSAKSSEIINNIYVLILFMMLHFVSFLLSFNIACICSLVCIYISVYNILTSFKDSESDIDFNSDSDDSISQDTNDYSDMPPLISMDNSSKMNSVNSNEYSDMPPLIPIENMYTADSNDLDLDTISDHKFAQGLRVYQQLQQLVDDTKERNILRARNVNCS